MPKRYNKVQALAILKDAIDAAGSQAEFADKHGISRQYLGDVLKERRDMGQKILEALGLIKIVEFEKK